MAVVDDRGRGPAAGGRGREDEIPAEDFGRQPPQDLAAEQSVLGGMLLSKDAVADVVEKIRTGARRDGRDLQPGTGTEGRDAHLIDVAHEIRGGPCLQAVDLHVDR